MELNREQVIKAFECCTLSGCNCLGGCPYRGTSGDWIGEECWRKARNDVFSLLKELIKENETLRGLYEHNSKLAIDAERKLVQCEKSYDNSLNRVHMLLKLAWESVEAKDQLLGTIKADTVQKMREQLSDQSEFLLRAENDGGLCYVDFCIWFDEIAKEILGEE